MPEPQRWRRASRERNRETDSLTRPSSARSFIVATGVGQNQKLGTALSITHYCRGKTKAWPTLDLKGEVTKDLQK